ncbi:MAG TPA: PfkB family carbohydrate kinase [Gaiellales bacterium]|nr:PfkB family carbohydrate kinase [Gaiellales bacterium]
MPEPLIVTLGDVLALSLITPLEGLLAESSQPAEIRLIVGGRAAVCACWVVAAEARARAVSARTYDRLGDLVEAELADRGVELEGPGVEGHTGVATVVRTPGGRRTALTDRGVCAKLAHELIQPEWFDDADVVHVSGYALVDQPSAGAVERACEIAREAGASLSVDLASADIVSPLVRQRILQLQPEVVLATAAQAQAIGGIDDLGDLAVISDDGALPAIDPMGTADAFAAGFMSALAAGADEDDALDDGRLLADRCAGLDGPLP